MKASEKAQQEIYYAKVSSYVKQLLLGNLLCLDNKKIGSAGSVSGALKSHRKNGSKLIHANGVRGVRSASSNKDT